MVIQRRHFCSFWIFCQNLITCFALIHFGIFIRLFVCLIKIGAASALRITFTGWRKEHEWAERVERTQIYIISMITIRVLLCTAKQTSLFNVGFVSECQSRALLQFEIGARAEFLEMENFLQFLLQFSWKILPQFEILWIFILLSALSDRLSS